MCLILLKICKYILWWQLYIIPHSLALNTIFSLQGHSIENSPIMILASIFNFQSLKFWKAECWNYCRPRPAMTPGHTTSGSRASGTNKFRHIFISVNRQAPHTDKTFYYKTFLFHFLSRLLSNGFYVGDLVNSIIDRLNSCYFDISPGKGQTCQYISESSNILTLSLLLYYEFPSGSLS